MLLQLECYVISCHTLEWIDTELLISTSGPWWKWYQYAVFTIIYFITV